MTNQNQNGIASFLAILIVIVIGVLAIGGVFAYQYWWAPEEEAEVEVPKDETTGWKTYRNEEYGFELKYDANKYKIENDTYGWPYAIVLFSKFGAGQSYYLAIEIWNSEDEIKKEPSHAHPYALKDIITKKIDDKYLTLWNINREEEITKILSTFKFIE